MSEDEKGFEVTDKRKAKQALETGGDESAASPGAKEEGPGEPEKQGGSRQPGAEARAAGGESKKGGELPPLDFLSFIGSLAATAFMMMGERLSADMPESEPDLPAAKQMIDLIDLLKAKTSGNLEKHETDGLESILYNLRMHYIQKSKGAESG